MNLTEVIGLLPLLVSVGSIDKNFANCLLLSFLPFFDFKLFINFSFSFSVPFLTFQLAHTSFILFYSGSRHSRTPRALSVSAPPSITSLSLHPINTFSLFSPLDILHFFFLFPFFSAPTHVLFLFSFWLIMQMHILYYLHLCSVPNYDKARCSHTFLLGT